MALLESIRLGRKGSQGANDLAYLSIVTLMKKVSTTGLKRGKNNLRYFPSTMTQQSIKLELVLHTCELWLANISVF